MSVAPSRLQPRRPINHPPLLARTAGITAVGFALCVGVMWAQAEHWPAPALAAAVVILGLASGQALGAGRANSAGLDLAAITVLAAVWSAAFLRAALVGVQAVVAGVLGVAMVAAVVGCAVYLWSGARPLADVFRRAHR